MSFFDLGNLSKKQKDEILFDLTLSDGCPYELLKQVVDSGNDLCTNVSINPITPADLLERLSTHKDQLVRFHVASHVNTPSHVLTKLLTDKSDAVRWAAEVVLRERRQSHEEG